MPCTTGLVRLGLGGGLVRVLAGAREPLAVAAASLGKVEARGEGSNLGEFVATFSSEVDNIWELGEWQGTYRFQGTVAADMVASHFVPVPAAVVYSGTR